jgi:biotin synthase-like enzyme
MVGGVAHNFEEARDLIQRLRAIEEKYQRDTPLEITVTAGALTADTVKRLAELGVERVMASVPARDYVGGLHKFHDEVMTKV